MRFVHGMSRTRIFNVWHMMIERCENPKHSQYKYYGARGIKVCARWKDPKTFAEDMGSPAKGMTIERKNNDGNYEPGNCIWAPMSVQRRNARDTVRITFNGKTQCLKDWAQEYGIKYTTLRRRLNIGGMSFSEAVQTPIGKYTRRR